MRIPERQENLNALIREYFTKPKTGAQENGRGQDSHAGILSDEEVVDLCRRANNAAKFVDLFDAGDVSAYDGDDSRADLALVSMLAFYTQDEDQLDRLFSQAALYREEKWGRRPDYRHRTIRTALANATETYTPSRSLGSTGMSNESNNDLNNKIQAISFSGREKPGPREWVVENSLWKGHAASWFGEGGVAKSLLAMHLGLTVAEKSLSSWMGFAVKTVPVLYVDFELDADEQHRRAYSLATGMGLPDVPENFYYLSVAMFAPEEAFEIAAGDCCRLNVGLVIVDSVGFALGGDSEKASDVLGFYRDCVQPLKDAGASPLLIDHQAKIVKGEKYSDKQAFGSVYKSNAVRSIFQMRGSHDRGEITATFSHKKNSFGTPEQDFSLKVLFEEECTMVERLEAAIPSPDREPSKKELVFEAIEEMGPATAETVADKTGINLQTVRNSISELLNDGSLVDTGEREGRSRIVATHSHLTEGTGMGTSAEDYGGMDF